MGTYEVTLIIVGGVGLGFYLNGLFRLYRATRKVETAKPRSRAAGTA